MRRTIAQNGAVSSYPDPTDSYSRVVTGTGESWKPHFTLLALQGKERPSFAGADWRDIVIENPILAIGLSGLYGHFKTALAVAGADIQPTPPGKSIPMLENILARTF